MLYKEIPYRVSPAANTHLLSLFEHMHRNTVNRRANSAVTYNGTVMVNTEPARNPHGVSHALNLLATHTNLIDWQDQRTPGQRRRCDEQLSHPTFTTARQLLQYTREYGQLKYATIWSDEPIQDTNNDTGEPLTKQNHIHLHLSPSAINFYKSLALHHKMAPLVPPRSYSASTNNHVSACLEAIGSGWLAPPTNYYDLITDPTNINTNMTHQLDRSGAVYSSTRRRLYGNHSHEPYVHKPLDTYKHDLTNLQMNPDLIYNGLTPEQITAIKALQDSKE